MAAELQRVVAELAVPATFPGSRVLDYGCAQRPYRSLFGPDVDYIGADIEGNPSVELVLNRDGTVPSQDAQFDLVLSTQVLEHVERPNVYIAECHRVLKPGGTLVLTTHGMMHYHPDPVDYWRWTSAGLRLILSDAGLSQVEIQGVLGLAPTALQLFQQATLSKVPNVLLGPYVATMQVLVERLDRRYSAGSRADNSLVLAARARRPGS